MRTGIYADVGQSDEALEPQRSAFEGRRKVSQASASIFQAGATLSAILPSGCSER
jgi:hypothetical protein